MEKAGWPILCRAMAGPGKSAEFILFRYNIINTVREAKSQIFKYMC
jgi:hypothetical protein